VSKEPLSAGSPASDDPTECEGFGDDASPTKPAQNGTIARERTTYGAAFLLGVEAE
jgi:hypothetical protein